MALSKKAAKEIASLVNSAMVAVEMAAAAKAKGDRASTYLWLARDARVTIELADKFGIELPALAVQRENLKHFNAMYDQLTLVG